MTELASTSSSYYTALPLNNHCATPSCLSCPAGDYKVVREAAARVEHWAYSAALQFDPQADHAQSDLRKVELLLGPYHWSLHFMLSRQNGEHAALTAAACVLRAQHPCNSL
jgi:hypothetical protein